MACSSSQITHLLHVGEMVDKGGGFWLLVRNFNALCGFFSSHTSSNGWFVLGIGKSKASNHKINVVNPLTPGAFDQKYIFLTFAICFSGFEFFFSFPFSPLLIFLQEWLTFYWACFQFENFQFLSIFMHILGSSDPITLVWVSLERSFPPTELEYKVLSEL